MAVTINKGRGTPHGFDPTPKPGWNTFLVHKEKGHSFLVLSYKAGVMRLKGKSGNSFDSKFMSGVTDLQYDVVIQIDPSYVAPPPKRVKKQLPPSVLSHGKEGD